MEFTDQQKRKLLASAEIVDKGDMAVLEKMMEFQDFVNEETKKIDGTIEEITSFKNTALAEIQDKFDNLAEVKDGQDYVLTDQDKRDIARSIPVPVVEKILEKTIITKEQPIVTEIVKVTNEIKEVALKDTPDETVDKVNASNKTIQKDRIEGLADIERIAKNNQASVPVTTSFFNGLRAKNLNISGATAKQNGDTVTVTVTAGTGTVSTIVAGTGISVDSTDPANPIVTNTGSSPSFVDNEVVSGSGTTYTLANTPIAGSVHVYALGQRLKVGAGNDYTISGTTLTMANSWSTGDIIADYRK